MRLSDLADLPATIDARQLADLFGCSYWSVLEQVKAGTCPVAPLRLGRKLRWSTAAVLRLLEADTPVRSG